jgi:hypothetical protein
MNKKIKIEISVTLHENKELTDFIGELELKAGNALEDYGEGTVIVEETD